MLNIICYPICTYMKKRDDGDFVVDAPSRKESI